MRSDSGGSDLPQDLQCGGRRGPPALFLCVGSGGWGIRARHRGVYTGHSTAGGIFSCLGWTPCLNTVNNATLDVKRPYRSV